MATSADLAHIRAMPQSPRINVSLSQPLRDWLHAKAGAVGISVGELMRRLLDEARATDLERK